MWEVERMWKSFGPPDFGERQASHSVFRRVANVRVVATSIDALSSSSSKSTPDFHPNSPQNHPRSTSNSIQNRSWGSLGLPRHPKRPQEHPRTTFERLGAPPGRPRSVPGAP